jgi:23S rRNA (cytosine1962-C5)-methyltransferase
MVTVTLVTVPKVTVTTIDAGRLFRYGKLSSMQNPTTTGLRRDIAVWEDYELLDTGGHMKLERFGSVVVARPEPQALWSPATTNDWDRAEAHFQQLGEEGKWNVTTAPSEDWSIGWEDLRFGLKLFSFKHTGVFPEQAANWAFLRANLRPGMKVLNLFGYTGGASLAALSTGAEVVHLDASRPAITAAKHNAELSGLADKPCRWIEDDAMKFVERETRRGNVYDAIIMDPPAFGRGPNKEVWRFEEDLPPLFRACAKIVKPGSRLIVNAYSMGFPALVVEQTLRDVFPNVTTESVELVLKESNDRGFLLPAGITIRAVV